MDGREIAVKVQDLTKSFHIPLEASSGIKQILINFLKGRKGYRIFKPLNDISFEVKKGDFFGIVGRNGSGKSTLLKTIAGIYTPQEGFVRVNGTLVPFIELGVGFNPELTGRENVFLNGALLGFSRAEMDAMYVDIVEFAELHDFMEERLKNYSSGMQVRLAFSIAIQAQGDVLLLDEVLAVGDEAFQRKCFSYFDELKKNKRTVILVTHDMSSVEKYCTKALMLDEGKIVKIGKPAEVAELYSLVNKTEYLKAREAEHERIVQRKKNDVVVTLYDVNGKQASRFATGDTMRVNIKWADKQIKNVGIAIVKTNGEYVFGVNTLDDRFDFVGNEISYDVKLTIGTADYSLIVGVFGEKNDDVIDLINDAAQFSVDSGTKRWGGTAQLNYEWKLNH